MLKNKICDMCNQKIGQLEEPFLKTSPIGLIRKYYGISGRKKHKDENQFYRGSQGTPPIQTTGKNPIYGNELLWEVTGENETKQLSQLILEDEYGQRITNIG